MPRELKRKIVEDPILKTRVMFLLGCDYLEMAKELKKLKLDVDEDYFKNAEGAQLNFVGRGYDNPMRVVWVEHSGKTPEAIGVAAHEIFHLVVRICEWKGIPITAQNNQDETAAYLQDFYMCKYIDLLYKKPKRKNIT